MKVVTWNCRGGFHSKWERLLALKPDIAIVQECAEPDMLRRKAPNFSYRNCDWHGTVPSKGLAIFSFGDWSLARDSTWNVEFHHFLPERRRSLGT